MVNRVKTPISAYINSKKNSGTSITERIENYKRRGNIDNMGCVNRIQHQSLHVPDNLINWRYFPDELKVALYGKKYRKQPKGISCERTREYEETVEQYGVDDDFYWLGLPNNVSNVNSYKGD